MKKLTCTLQITLQTMDDPVWPDIEKSVYGFMKWIIEKGMAQDEALESGFRMLGIQSVDIIHEQDLPEDEMDLRGAIYDKDRSKRK